MQIDKNGDWLLGARKCVSPNCNERPQGTVINLLVIHGISLPFAEFGTGCIESLFLNELDTQADPRLESLQGVRVSAHLLIDRKGMVTQFVPFRRRAWHAGKSSFDGLSNCNDFSIGIELEGTDESAYAAIQYTRLAEITDLLLERFPAISRERIVGHCHIAPNRKTDPGSSFNWEDYFSFCQRLGKPRQHKA
ncbi:MAG: 1,6-anhydro-N-acetylmuramyl-L-alanine amidase AmpD [Candidatus Eutrophobiaceae bacterium]